MSERVRVAGNTEVADARENEISLPELERPFTLKDWRLWAASFGFFWSLYICGAISMLSFEHVGVAQHHNFPAAAYARGPLVLFLCSL